MELDEEILLVRTKLGLTQKQASKAWGISVYTLRQWESQWPKPSGFAVKYLRAILDPVLVSKRTETVPASLPSPQVRLETGPKE